MSTITTETPYASTTVTADRTTAPLCWGAVIAGAIAALSAHLLITTFGVGLGVQMIDARSDPDPAKRFSVGVGIVWSISALLSLWLGGWVAGRLTPEPSRGLGRLHGMLVWSLATVVMAFAVTTSSGLLLGGVAKLTGEGLAFAGRQAGPVVAAGGDFVKRAVESNPDLIGSFVREAVPEARDMPAGDSPQAQSNPGAQRELSWALVRFFSRDKNDRPAEARAALVRAVASATGVDEAQASQRVDSWITAYDQVQADLADMARRTEQSAREAADAASGYVTHAAVWTVVAFLIGAISAAWGGTSGARSRREYDAVTPAEPA
ncbi:MAG TPA: hypothetical protein VK178_04050 [Opitutaceae bacterium]|nr:hypothetical protein [Opitutaceae bacterium]